MKYKIAAIICTYNREKHLINALNSFKNQTISKNEFQVIVVDNNSRDNTATVVKGFIKENPSLVVSYIFEETPGLSAARNRGWREAEAPVIAYLDDDAIADSNWLKAFVSFFEKNINAAGAGGKVIPLYEAGEPVWMNKYLNGFVGKKDCGLPEREFDKKMKYPSGNNMAWKRDILQEIGGFNPDLQFRSDDKYIFLEVKKVSDEIWWVPEAIVEHVVDEERLAYDNFKKLFLKTGNEERVRLHGSLRKLIEYVIKFCASLLIYMLFLIKGQGEKGKYVVLSQFFTLKGFLIKRVIIR
jgi:glycosyltransferase involved in cell wall biosynthesis